MAKKKKIVKKVAKKKVSKPKAKESKGMSWAEREASAHHWYQSTKPHIDFYDWYYGRSAGLEEMGNG